MWIPQNVHEGEEFVFRRATNTISSKLVSKTMHQETEIGCVNITPENTEFEDFTFQVIVSKAELMHDQFECVSLTLAISSKQIDISNEDVGLNLWTDKTYVASAQVPRISSYEHLPHPEIDAIRDRDAAFFGLSVNPEFVGRSWLVFQAKHADGRVRMNCILPIKDFIENSVA